MAEWHHIGPSTEICHTDATPHVFHYHGYSLATDTSSNMILINPHSARVSDLLLLMVILSWTIPELMFEAETPSVALATNMGWDQKTHNCFTSAFYNNSLTFFIHLYLCLPLEMPLKTQVINCAEYRTSGILTIYTNINEKNNKTNHSVNTGHCCQADILLTESFK